MAFTSNSHIVSSFRYFSQIASNIVIFIGCIVLIGWLLNISLLMSLLPVTPKMMPNTAIAFVLAGIALRYKGRIAQACAAIITTIGLLTSQPVYIWH